MVPAALLSLSITTAAASSATPPPLRAAPCHGSFNATYAALRGRQQFAFDPAAGGAAALAADPSQCLTGASAGPAALAPCRAGSAAQRWAPMGNLSADPLRLQGGQPVGLQNGGLTNAVVWVGHTSARAPVSFLPDPQHPGQGTFVIAPRGGFNDAVGCGRGCSLCVTSGPPVRPCDQPSPAAAFPMCDSSLPLSSRVADLVKRIPEADVAKLLVNSAGPVPSLWIASQNWWSEALHGVQSGCATGADGRSRCPISFPAAISTAAAFNKSLFFSVGDAIGTEARAMSNVGAADGWTFWSPNLNIARDPRWGRGQETPGEDPTLNGEYGAQFIAGFQGANASASPDAPLRSSSCAKHFFAYSLENCFTLGDNCRLNFNAVTSQQDIEDTYLPAFQSAVQRGGVSGLMCSYNAINGVPACANSWSMTTVAREAWGFAGYVTSDCGAVAGVTNPEPKTHPWSTSTAATLRQSGNAAREQGITSSGGHGFKLPRNSSLATAGLDSNCNLGGGSIDDRPGPEGVVARRRALNHLFAVQFRLGLFDAVGSKQNPFSALDETSVASEQHQRLALEAARQGVTLLKNADSTLPLKRGLGSLALLGPCLEVRNGGYSKGGSGGPLTGSAAAALANYSGAAAVKVVGCADPQTKMGKRKSSEIDCAADAEEFAAATQAASQAAATIVAIGIDGSFEGENGDFRAFAGIALPGAQGKLVEAVAAAAPKPITVIVTGSSVDIAEIKKHPKVGSIVHVGYLGEAAGQAVADVLFGEHNPAGRLTTTWYPADFNSAWKPGVDPWTGGVNSRENSSYFDSSMRPNATTGNPGRTHRFFQGQPVYRFGEGLSYTSFRHELRTPRIVAVDSRSVEEYAAIASTKHLFGRTASSASLHTATVSVTNTGARAGAHTVLAFVSPPSAGLNGSPLRELLDFHRTEVLRVGETVVVSFDITAHDLTRTRREGGRMAEMGDWLLRIGEQEVTLRVS